LSHGIGLAFAVVALNGLFDDLLFNIPTSMFLWMLAALAAKNLQIKEV
jgi:putative inorganic carbon (HCO3(-)) transporter